MFGRHGCLTVLWVAMLTTLPVANPLGQIFLPGAAVCRRGGGVRPAVGWNLRKSRSRRGEFAVFRTRIGVKKIPPPGKLSAFQDVTNSARGSRCR